MPQKPVDSSILLIFQVDEQQTPAGKSDHLFNIIDDLSVGCQHLNLNFESIEQECRTKCDNEESHILGNPNDGYFCYFMCALEYLKLLQTRLETFCLCARSKMMACIVLVSCLLATFVILRSQSLIIF